ncbi:hypothetical protein RXP22_28870, partial [Pseudomonas aeruginosa]|nr:hypothetical protein [Pseudomonas aeruginosa]
RTPESIPEKKEREPNGSQKKSGADDALQASSALAEWASAAAVSSFLAYRRRGKAKALTLTGAKRLATHLKAIFDAGGDTDDALAMAEERGWQTVEPSWYFKERNPQNANRNIGRISESPKRVDPALNQIARLTG